jgi:hypothetical protein
MLGKILLLFVVYLLTACVSVEEQSYTTIKKTDAFEIRSYPTSLVAEVAVEGNFNNVGNKGFRILADFIFGKNTRSITIKDSSTESQIIKNDNEKIKMTAPVEMNKKENKYVIRFIMPSKYTLKSLPKPLDKRITIKKTKESRKAALTYYGSWSESNFKTHEDLLIKLLQKNSISWSGNVIFARYNSPWTLWFLRKNEVIVQLD